MFNCEFFIKQLAVKNLEICKSKLVNTFKVNDQLPNVVSNTNQVH